MWDWSIVSKIWLCLLIAAILGGIIGWLLRTFFGSKCEKCDNYEGTLRDRDNEIANLNSSFGNVNASAGVENTKNDADIAVWKKKVSVLEADLKICHDRQGTMEGELKDWSTKAVGLSSAAPAAAVGNTADLKSDVEALRGKKAESDETLKVVPMEQRDDLELVHGIGPVIEGILYDSGVYFFKDIAGWDAAKIAAINEQLPGFQGRIERENWVASAKEEHFKKYGERL